MSGVLHGFPSAAHYVYVSTKSLPSFLRFTLSTRTHLKDVNQVSVPRNAAMEP
jgi:hypothetical protein